MRRIAFGLLVSSVTFMAGCAGSSGESTGAGPATNPATTAASAPVAPGPSATTLDAATKKACEALLASIKDSDKKVAAAEKIGGPVGYVAVGAEYLAASADLSARSRGVTDAEVKDAADKVGDEMTALDEAWQKNPGKKPSEKALTSAVTELKSACAAG